MPGVKNNSIEKILALIKERIGDENDKKLVQRAYAIASQAHETQYRESGDPYIIHPLETALTLAQMNLDTPTIIAALLHDVVDDTPVTLTSIEKEFGNEVAFLVDGVSKLGKLKYRGAERHAENLRKMLVAMAQDIRVILIKFADRLHNMKTLDSLPERKQKRIAAESLEIYAAIATRLGMSEIAQQLENLAFPYIYPDQYNYVKTEANFRFPQAERDIKKIPPIILAELQKEKIEPYDIEIRKKNYYSLWQKLEKYNYNWAQIHDLVAMRILVNSIEECYGTLGIIHKLWKPLPGRIKDYIALPKPSGYQSLHTTVFCMAGRRTEFQIRTRSMHENAEYGIAAHWRYKNKAKQSTKKIDKTYAWISQLQDWKKDTRQSEEFLDSLKIDVFGDRIFVFTPAGDVIDLPVSATPVDFAYAIHSDIGSSCAGAIVNGKMTALSSELNNGDVVDILREKNKTPARSWLTFVKTSAAKNHIKKWLREQNREENMRVGLDLLNEELKSIEGRSWTQLVAERKNKMLSKFSYTSEDNLLAAIGQGDMSAKRVSFALIADSETKTPVSPRRKRSKQKKNNYIRVAGESGLQIHIAQCCTPAPPAAITAYVTIDRGASIHKATCENLHNAQNKTDRVLPAIWTESRGGRCIQIIIQTIDRIGMIQDISRIIASMNINILSMTTKKPNVKLVRILTEVEINDLNQLAQVIEKLKSINGVLEVTRNVN